MPMHLRRSYKSDFDFKIGKIIKLSVLQVIVKLRRWITIDVEILRYFVYIGYVLYTFVHSFNEPRRILD